MYKKFIQLQFQLLPTVSQTPSPSIDINGPPNVFWTILDTNSLIRLYYTQVQIMDNALPRLPSISIKILCLISCFLTVLQGATSSSEASSSSSSTSPVWSGGKIPYEIRGFDTLSYANDRIKSVLKEWSSGVRNIP